MKRKIGTRRIGTLSGIGSAMDLECREGVLRGPESAVEGR